MDSGRSDVGAREDETAQLIDRRQGALRLALARHAHVVGVRCDRANQLRRVAEPLELGHRHARMACVRIGIALVVEVVKEAAQPPQLLVAAALARLGAHRRLHGQAVSPQRVRPHPLPQQCQSMIARERFFDFRQFLIQRVACIGNRFRLCPDTLHQIVDLFLHVADLNDRIMRLSQFVANLQ